MPFVCTDPADRAYYNEQAAGEWQKAVNLAVLKPEAKTVAGLNLNVYKATDQNSNLYNAKWAAVKTALEACNAAGVLMQQSAIQEFKVVFYGNAGNSSTSPSRGILYLDSPDAQKPTLVLQLGSRAVQHACAVLNFGEAQGIAAGGGAQSPPRIVADRFYDYYKSTKTVSAKDKCILAQTFHELGHIFHQYQQPKQFHANARQIVARAKNANAETVGKNHVSEYAGKEPATWNEFVSETFSGIMMGVPWDKVNAGVMNEYRNLKGPMVQRPPEAISRLPDFLAQTCECDPQRKTRTGGIKIDMWN